MSAGVLAILTKESNDHSLKLGDFRPEKSLGLSAMTEMPYSAQISGPYPAIRAVMADLDTSTSKVALHSAQIASSEQASNVVTATLGVSAYLATDAQILSAPAGKEHLVSNSTTAATTIQANELRTGDIVTKGRAHG